MLTSLGGGLLGLLDRRFVLSAWLPAMLLLGGLGALVVTGIGWSTSVHWWLTRPGQFQVVLFVLALAWVTFCAYLIAALVPAFIRIGEGYWPRWLSWLAGWCRNRQLVRQTELGKDAAAFGRWHADYPLRSGSVMPTRLGNILRAAEDHALDRYGINAIVVWPRLYVLLPDQFTAAMAAAKTPLDLMAVIGALATVFTVAGTTIAAIMLPWYTALACGVGGLLVGLLAYAGAVQAARPYAQLVRSGFDVHRGLLLDAAGLRRPRTYGEERKQWEQISHLWLQGTPEGPAGASLLGYPGLPPTDSAPPSVPAATPGGWHFLRRLRDQR
jgi:hypothetical protein